MIQLYLVYITQVYSQLVVWGVFGAREELARNIGYKEFRALTIRHIWCRYITYNQLYLV